MRCRQKPPANAPAAAAGRTALAAGPKLVLLLLQATGSGHAATAPSRLLTLAPAAAKLPQKLALGVLSSFYCFQTVRKDAYSIQTCLAIKQFS